MAEHVDKCIMEAVEAATGVEFDMDRTATERLRLPARMKGGGVRVQHAQGGWRVWAPS